MNFYMNELFPTMVMYKDYPNLITKQLQDYSRNILKEYGNKPFYSPCISTVQTYSDILELPEYQEIKQSIIDTVSVYTNTLKIDNNNLSFLDSWLNLYNQHGYQDLHNHHDSMLSGVFYIKSVGNKDFVFQSPWHFQQAKLPNYTEQNLKNSHNIEYNSLEGRLIIFMSNTLHRTLPATEERISLSFNIG